MSATGATAVRPGADRRPVTGARVLAAVVLGLIAAVAGWLSAAIEPAAGDARADVWKLPAVPGAAAADAVKAPAERNIWGATRAAPQGAVAPTAPLTPPGWRIMATAVSGADRVVMIRIGTDTPQELRVGDKLPGGAIIRAIESDRLVLQIDSRRRVLRIPPP